MKKPKVKYPAGLYVTGGLVEKYAYGANELIFTINITDKGSYYLSHNDNKTYWKKLDVQLFRAILDDYGDLIPIRKIDYEET